MSSTETLYTHLDRETRSTRLLRLQAQQDDNTIHCILTSHTLDDAPPFIALSYVWGPPGPTHSIVVNDQTLPVRENLWDALVQLVRISHLENNCILRHKRRGAKLPEYFWIDAICINQEDDSERGYQVDLMKDIFSAANFVIAWIGEPEGNVPSLLEYLQELKRTPRGDRAQFLRTSKKRFAFKDARWLVSRPYWSRIWIVQEFTLARELYVLCGSDVVSWPALEQFRPFGISNRTNLGFKHLSKQENHYSIDKHVNSCRELSNLRRSWQSESKQPSFTDGDPESGARPTLTRLLAFCKDYQCADPRDRVYGLLGLTETDGQDRLSADYTLTPFQLYHRVIFHLNQQGRVLKQVFHSRLAEGLQISDDDDLPSSMFIYEAVAGRCVRRLLTSGSNVWKEQLLEDLEDYLGADMVSSGDAVDMHASYETVMSQFSSFPSEQDPATWSTFETAVKKAFGIIEEDE